MTLRVVGAGCGRTGTLSLKHALERLLGAPCYHMMEVFARPQDVPHWHAAALGEPVDWHALLEGYAAAVDWPPGAFWPELVDAFPDALVILSHRPAEKWWKSANETIFPNLRRPAPDPQMEPWLDMVHAMMESRFTRAYSDKAACIAAFDAHNAEVRRRVPAGRLLEWQPGDGWEPICAALDLPVPGEPFPHVNSTEEFQARQAAMAQQILGDGA
jgi:hypothetical protein